MDLTTLVLHADELTAESSSWGSLQWLCNARLSPGAQQTFGVCQILPGQGNPLHYHPNCEELLYVLSGNGRHLLDAEWVDLRRGTLIRVPMGMKHKLVNEGSEVLTCVIAFSSGARETVFLEG